jgi:hypothetical protein
MLSAKKQVKHQGISANKQDKYQGFSNSITKYLIEAVAGARQGKHA